MPFDSDAWIKRADEILAKGAMTNYTGASEYMQFATSLFVAIYGPNSAQLRALVSGADAISKKKDGGPHHLSCLARGAIVNAQAELKAGLITGLRAYVAGEVLAELVRLAKEILEGRTESAKNVGAVLTAAAFEDLIRRMGQELAGVAGRPKLGDVVTALQSADILKGGQIATCQGCLKFRNDSLHADWEKVDKSQVDSCLAFTESLLLKHFS